MYFIPVGYLVEPARPVYLEAHQRDEALVHDAGGEVLLRVPEARQVLRRQVHPPAPPVSPTSRKKLESCMATPRASA